MKPRRLVAPIIAVLIVLMVGMLFFGVPGPLARSLVCAVVDLLTGGNASIRELQYGADQAVIEGLHWERHGKITLDIRRLTLRYHPRDLLPGGRRRYGLIAFTADQPTLRIERGENGRFDLPGFSTHAGTATTPWRFTGGLRDGAIILKDARFGEDVSRALLVDRMNGHFTVDSSALTRYEGEAVFESAAPQPARLAGTIDSSRGWAMHHLSMPSLDLPAVLNYALNTHAVALEAGSAHDVDLRLYALDSNGHFPYHLTGGARVSGGVLRIAGFRRSLHDLGGRLAVFDNGVIFQDAHANLVGMPVAVEGGIYGREHPRFRLVAAGDGTLERLRSVFSFAKKYPVNGQVSLTTLLEGRVNDPLVFVGFSSSHGAYGRFPVEKMHGLVSYYARGVDITGATGRYGSLNTTVHGHITITNGNPLMLAIGAQARGRDLPYAAQIMPAARVRGEILLTGQASAPDSYALIRGEREGERFFAAAHLDSRGSGSFAPVVVTRADGSSLMGAFYPDRPRNQSAFWLAAGGFRFTESPSPPVFPGLSQFVLPNFGGVLDGVAGGSGSPSAFTIVGEGRARDAKTGALRFDEAAAAFAGSPQNVSFGGARAEGPWGSYEGEGGYAGNELALKGMYLGGFEQLRSLTGELGARGRISIPIGLLIDRRRIVVQVPDGVLKNVVVRGLPIKRLAGTMEIQGRRIRVDSASVTPLGGTMAGAGEIGGAGSLGVTAVGIEVRRFSPMLQAGTISAVGRFGYAGVPRFDGGFLLEGAKYAGRDVRADTTLSLRGKTVRFTDGQAAFAGTYGTISGSVQGIGTRDLAYDLGVGVRGMDIGTIADLLGRDRKDLEGTMDADLHLNGRDEAPRINGQIRVPEGAIHGLRFADAHADGEINLRRRTGEIRTGGVTVGSTRLAFSGGYVDDAVWLRVPTSMVDLADFNDYFDEGETLGGKGRIALRFEKKLRDHVPEVVTVGDIAVRDLRYRSFQLGDVPAHWQTKGNVVTGDIAFGGVSGKLHTAGSVVLARDNVLRRMFARSKYDLSTRLEGLDLGVWLPALGYHLPLVGRLDAAGIVRGRYPGLLIAGTASMDGGSIASYPIKHFDITMDASGKRMVIAGMELDLPSLSVRGNGSFGRRASDPLRLDAHASSPNVGAILTRATARGRTVSGALEADLHVEGTREHPRIAGSLEVEKAAVRGVAIPHVIASLALDRHDVIVRNAELDFGHGSLSAAGMVPFTQVPLGIGPGTAPVSLNLLAQRVDLSVFRPLFPPTSEIAGMVDGNLTLAGTVNAPRLRGKLALNAGMLSTPFERVPLRNISARVSFGKTKVHLTNFHANAGNGTLDARGTVTIADLERLAGDAAYSVTVNAKQAQLDFPAYGSGIVGGTLTIDHNPRELPFVHGALTFNDAGVPFSALYHPTQAASVNPPSGLDATFAVHAVAGRNVRVRSANMDINASGAVDVAGTLSAPKLDGTFSSNGGTLAYFNRVFRLLDGTVVFQPDSGVIPSMNAHAMTNVYDPNSYTGSTMITLNVTGPVTNLTIGLESDPTYDREQILALLLNEPDIGALLGSSAGAKATAGNQFVSAEAFSVINAQFTRALLTPIETAFGQALGLSNLNVDFAYTGGVNVTARKLLGKTVNAVYASDLSYPYRQSVGFELKPNQYTSARATFYQTLGQTGLGIFNTTNVVTQTNQILLSQPLSGTNGFSFSFLKYLR